MDSILRKSDAGCASVIVNVPMALTVSDSCGIGRPGARPHVHAESIGMGLRFGRFMVVFSRAGARETRATPPGNLAYHRDS